jgi:hypothetical protein
MATLLKRPIRIRVTPWLTVLKKYKDVTCSGGCGTKATPTDKRVWATRNFIGGPGNGGTKKTPSPPLCWECAIKRDEKRRARTQLRANLWRDEKRARRKIRPVRAKRKRQVKRNIAVNRRLRGLRV